MNGSRKSLTLLRHPEVPARPISGSPGIGHFAPDAPFYESARPFTRRVIAEFGPDRLVWGGGSPRIVDQHMATYSLPDRQKVKGGNLARLMNVGVAA